MQNIIYVHVSNLTKILCNSKYFLLTIVLKSYHVGLYIDLVGFFLAAFYFITRMYYISVIHFCSGYLPFILSTTIWTHFLCGKFPLYVSLWGEQKTTFSSCQCGFPATRVNRLLTASYCSRISWEILNCFKNKLWQSTLLEKWASSL